MREVERHIRVSGTQIFVRDIGEGSPVVLFNGIGAHVEMWRPMERALDGMRIISFDAPGTGRSATPLLPLSMSGLAGLVERLLERLAVERFDLVGYSFGGALAQQFALQAPQRLRRLVLAATLPGWGGVPGDLNAMLSLGTPLRYYSRSFYEQTAGTTAGGRTRYDRDHVARLWHDRAGNAPTFRGYSQQLWTMTTWSSLRWLSRIETPTLIVVGDDDPLVPMSNAFMMAARMPNARVFVGRDEGHFQLLDDSSMGSIAIRQFLEAERHTESRPWRSRQPVTDTQVSQQMRADGLGALPWGAISAVLRLVLR